MIAVRVAVPIPPSSKSPIFTVKLPAPMVSAAATVMRLRLALKSTLFSTQIRAPVAALTMGAGNFTVKIGDFELGGIGTATLTAIVLYQILTARGSGGADEVPA